MNIPPKPGTVMPKISLIKEGYFFAQFYPAYTWDKDLDKF